jgi:hypothetical protein
MDDIPLEVLDLIEVESDNRIELVEADLLDGNLLLHFVTRVVTPRGWSEPRVN